MDILLGVCDVFGEKFFGVDVLCDDQFLAEFTVKIQDVSGQKAINALTWTIEENVNQVKT